MSAGRPWLGRHPRPRCEPCCFTYEPLVETKAPRIEVASRRVQISGDTVVGIGVVVIVVAIAGYVAWPTQVEQTADAPLAVFAPPLESLALPEQAGDVAAPEIDWEPDLIAPRTRRPRPPRLQAIPPPPVAVALPAPAPASAPTAAAPAEMPAVTAAYRLGVQYLGERKPLLALEAFEEILRLDSEHALAWRGLGVANVMAGRTEHAARAFERFVEIAPGHPSADRVRGALADYYEGR